MEARARTQRRGDETKQRLIETTKALFSQADYQSLTLDQIAATVGVAKSSILWHFGSREGLLSEAIYSLFEEVEQKIILKKDDLPGLEERIDYLLDTVAAYFDTNPAAKGIVISLIFSSQTSPDIRRSIEEQWNGHITQVAEFLIDDQSADCVDLSGAIIALLHGTYTQWVLKDRAEPIAPLLKRYMHALRAS